MPTPYQPRSLGPVIVDVASAPYWEGTRAGVLRYRRGIESGRPHFYPRALCPFTLEDTEWADSAGKGEIYSVSVTRRAGPVPYAIAYVRLDEGFTMLTNIVDCDLDTVRIGDRVRVVFQPAEDGNLVPMFTPDR